jgi:alpha-amylase
MRSQLKRIAPFLAALVVLVTVCVAAASAAGRPQALGSLGAPASVTAGTRFQVKGTVANLPARGRARARIAFTLLPSRKAKRGRALGTKTASWRKGTARRSFSLRLRMPAGTTPRRYYLRACVRKSCRVRALTVRAASGQPGGGAPDPGTGTPGPGTPVDTGARRSLRAPLTGENFYFLMADRFENGSAANDTGGSASLSRSVHGFDPTSKGYFHGGDLVGLLSRLDYIEGLGTTAIWLTPSFKNKPVQGSGPFESAGYHGHWITDFTQIDPHFGTNAELLALVNAAHARGIKIFLDVITNYTADVVQYAQKGSGPVPPAYVSKAASPYRDEDGNAFDDRDHAGKSSFPPLSASASFPFTPTTPPGSETKVPAWLNDVTMYHNRGDTTFSGENSLYGDFFGLDDLFTERPQVVSGMVDIYKGWITNFGIDGFRLDTMKNVNDEFWRVFAPDLLAHARSLGKSEFFMFGEVFDTSRTFTSHFSTSDRVQAVNDFPFQAAARSFAADSGATDALRDFFAADDWYTDADSNVYQLPTFLGNHDMGRIGLFLRNANAGASDLEIFKRDRLAHALMYFSRGNPTVYYGDEQGFVGDGGDQQARQDMFPSQVPDYNDDDLIANDATTADSNFDRSSLLYETIAQLAAVTREHPALRNGAQQHRRSAPAAGIYAFSRFDRTSQREYVVALNNSEETKTAAVPTAAGPAARLDRIYGPGPASLVTDGSQNVSIEVPALSAVVYRSAGPIPLSPAAPSIAIDPNPSGGAPRDRVEVAANVDGNSFYDVTFQARVGAGPWTTIGTDDNSPYRVFHDVNAITPGTTVSYRAIVLDNAEHARMSGEGSVVIADP